MRFVAARANLIALSTASAPELVKNTRSMPGCDRATSSSARTPGSRAAVHLHEVGQVGVEGVVQRPNDGRMAPPEGEDAEAGQEVEVPVPLVVDEVAALPLLVEAVELDRARGPGAAGG